MSKVIFITTDKVPIHIKDRYYIVLENGDIQCWNCTVEDSIPTCNTYSSCEKAKEISMKIYVDNGKK